MDIYHSKSPLALGDNLGIIVDIYRSKSPLALIFLAWVWMGATQPLVTNTGLPSGCIMTGCLTSGVMEG